MKILKQLYHFLGSIYLAILLIALTAIFVAAGTVLEAWHDSHLFSASFTYHHPVFFTLIWGFFINILISALRRWPFQKKHIPFLMTHLGLLLLLSGVMVKSYFGVQGSMSILEGGSNYRIFLPHTHVIRLEKKDPPQQIEYPLDYLFNHEAEVDGMSMRLIDYAPHSYEQKESWIKGDHAFISGYNPLAVNSINPTQIQFHQQSTPWNVLALSTSQVSETAKHFYLDGLIIRISDPSGELISELPLLKALEQPLPIFSHTCIFSLEWNNSFNNLSLNINIDQEKLSIPLTGSESLINKNVSTPYRGKLPFIIDLQRKPLLLMIHDDQGDDTLLFFNAYGEIDHRFFKNDQLPSLIVYAGGFGGYAVQTLFPFDQFPQNRHDKEEAKLFHLALQLRQNLKAKTTLSPPLQLFQKSIDPNKGDLAAQLLQFLKTWDRSGQLLFTGPYNDDLSQLAQKMDWNGITLEEQYACGWLCYLLEEMDEALKSKNLYQILQERGWPFAHKFQHFNQTDPDQMIVLLAQQLRAAATELPPPPVLPEKMALKAFSAFLRAYGITLNTIMNENSDLRSYHAARIFHSKVRNILSPLIQQPVHLLARLISSLPQESPWLKEINLAYLEFQNQLGNTQVVRDVLAQEILEAFITYAPLSTEILSENEIENLSRNLNAKDLYLETPLTLRHQKLIPLKKWEDNHPLVTLEINKDGKKEYITLAYDKYGTGLAWPILNGDYRMRYQPQFVEIPYRIRLHDGRQINYPGTQQPFSYESDLIITNRTDQTKVEATLSMNNVYETKDGYRLYLASLSPPFEEAPQRVQIVVNYDPAKYILTYPGALFLTLGIIFLFWPQGLRP